MIENYEIRRKARESLKGKWNVPVIVQLILFAISVAVSAMFPPALSLLLNIIFSGALAFGVIVVMLMLIRKKKPLVKNMFDGFKMLERTIPLSLWMTLFILLWALLLVIPGIVAAFRYSMSYYILYDNPKIKARNAIANSKEMMLGYKWKLFCLHFSFIGWYILGIFTLGIAWLWVASYQGAAAAIFYEELKKEKAPKKSLRKTKS